MNASHLSDFSLFFPALLASLVVFGSVYFYNRHRFSRRKKSELLEKYQDLLQPFIAQKKISLKESDVNRLIINFSEARTHTTFALYEIENKICVTWGQNNEQFGTRGKEWYFQKDSDQQQMQLQIRNDIETYLRGVRN